MCFGSTTKDFSIDESGLNEYVYEFSVDYGSTDVDDILDIHKYLKKKNDYRDALSNFLVERQT